MFTELAPLLADRTLLLTLSAAPGGIIRVNVIPKSRNETDAAESVSNKVRSVSKGSSSVNIRNPRSV